MSRPTRTSFSMKCPECDDVIDIESWVTVSFGREEFWGAPARTDDSECEVSLVSDCPTCKTQTIDEGEAEQHFWENEYERY